MINILIDRSGKTSKENIFLGNQHENLDETLHFSFPKEYDNFYKYITYSYTNNGCRITGISPLVDDNFIITSKITKCAGVWELNLICKISPVNLDDKVIDLTENNSTKEHIFISNTISACVSGNSIDVEAFNNVAVDENIASLYDSVLALKNRVEENDKLHEQNEAIRKANELERQEAETTRKTNESERVSAEQLRVEAENTRKADETKRQSNESARIEAETNRDTAESERVNAENQRAEAETARQSAETNRASAENKRASAEANRDNAENERINAETLRKQAESARVSAETARTQAEANRVETEKVRVSAENAREQAEQSRVNAESQRVTAEATRESAERARVEAESAREQAEQSRVNAENLRVEAENKREGTINDLKEQVDGKITKFYASNQGETHIIDSDNGKIQDMLIYGKASQIKTTGNNLLKPNLKYADAFDVDFKQGTVLTMISKNSAKNTKGGNLKITLVDGSIHWFGYDKNATKQQTTLTKDAVSAKYLFEYETSENYALYVGDYDKYEPYTGAKPSPSPEYPQDIKSVVNPTMKIHGANLLKLDFKKYENNGITLEVVGNKLRFHGTFTDTYTFFEVKDKPLIKKDTKVSLYVDNYNDHGAFAWLELLSNGNIDSLKKTSPTDTLQEDKYLNAIGIENYNIGDTIDFTTTIAVLDNTTTYQPYKEQTLTLPITLNAVPVTAGGNITIDGQRYVADYIDVERGKIVRRCQKATFNTNEGYADETYRLMFNLPSNGGDGESVCLYSAFQWVSWTTCVMSSKAYVKNIKKSDDEFYTAQELKDLNISFDIIYQLETPTEEDLTAEQIKALKELKTYYPTTNISVNSEQIEGYTVFNYPISMANGWNYVKQQLNDNRDYIYDTDLQSAEAYVNSEYVIALTELGV